MIYEEISTQPIVAYRTWTYHVDHRLLASPLYSRETTWTPGQKHEATCTACSSGWTSHIYSHPEDKPTPYFSCTCGIYGYREIGNLVAATDKMPLCRIFGEVYIWGQIIEHQYGYRAEFAYPAAIYLPVGPVLYSAKELANVYGAECKEMPSALFDKYKNIIKE